MISISFVIITNHTAQRACFGLTDQLCCHLPGHTLAPIVLHPWQKGAINLERVYFITCFPPEIPCGLAFIPSILKCVQRWRAARMRSILLIIFINMHACMICISRVMIFTLLTACSNEVS